MKYSIKSPIKYNQKNNTNDESVAEGVMKCFRVSHMVD